VPARFVISGAIEIITRTAHLWVQQHDDEARARARDRVERQPSTARQVTKNDDQRYQPAAFFT
jgi:hypothetical protein